MAKRGSKEVQEKLNKALTSHQQGLPLPSDQLTVGQYLLTWLEHSAKPKVRLSTLESYEEIVRLHLEPDLGKVQYETIKRVIPSSGSVYTCSTSALTYHRSEIGLCFQECR